MPSATSARKRAPTAGAPIWMLMMNISPTRSENLVASVPVNQNSVMGTNSKLLTSAVSSKW